MGIKKSPFIDATFAAELLGVQTIDVLDFIAAGKLTSYGGKDRNPFVQTVQVEQLAAEMGRDPAVQPSVRKRASQNPVRRVELRLRHDARWSDVSDEDIRVWARGLEPHTRVAARKIATTAVEGLQHVLSILDKSDQPSS